VTGLVINQNSDDSHILGSKTANVLSPKEPYVVCGWRQAF